ATFINGRWKIQLPDGTNHATEARTGFGTGHYPFTKLVNAAFTNQTVKIRRKDSDGTEYVDIEATDEANARIGDIRTKFGEWLWSDPERRAGLEAEYNEARNAYATPKYDGSFLRMEGMALSLGRGPFNLREHQVNAIWRALVNRRSINAHEVGTGKTFTMGGIAVESRRYGIAKKPMLLAHNANSASVAAEIQMMYPGAKALYIDNLSPDTIAVKMRQIANDDWDVVVMPHSLIDRLSFREETLMTMAQDDIKALEEEAYAAAEDDGVTLDADMLNDEEELKKLRSVTAKELVKARNRIIETIKKQAMQSSKEGAIAFEDLGIDMVLVDEVHEFKKPPISTRMNMKGLNTQTSNRSIALQFITRYIRANNFGGNVHTFTGTPITNTMTEIFHQMRYVMEDEMKAAGVDSWDGWFGSFAKEVQDVELSAAGEYETITRLAGFINVPELRRMIGQYMDVVFADDMPEMQPRQVNGKTLTAANLTEAERAELLNGRTEGAADRPYKKVINVTSDLTSEQSRIFARLQGYARAWRSMGGKARIEAMRSGAPESPIITEGMANKASFDVRLTEDERWAGMEGQAPDDPGSKASKLVANVAEIYKSDPSAAQVVFSDVGYSTSQKRSAGRNAAGDKVYRTVKTFSTVRDIVERLVQQGIPREQIAVVDGSTSKEKRKEIADSMNSLAVRVVIGSTDTLGVGVNMQRNLRAMHHLDAPYMPGELEQRNGRGLRQGNQWNTVLEYRYMTDRLDGRRWQILAIKQRFITAFMKSNSDSRVIEGDAASDEESDILQSFSEAAGDPRILIRAKLQKNVEALRRAERMHGNGVADARRTLRGTREAIEWNRGKLKEMTANNLLQRLRDMVAAQSDDFRMSVRGTLYDARADAGDAIDQFLTTDMRMEQSGVEVGQYRDQAVTARWPSLSNQPELVMEVDGQEFSSSSLRGLEQQIRNYPQRVEKVQAYVDQREASIERLEQVSKSPFARAKDLDAAVKRLDALVKDIEGNPVPPPAWLRAGAPVDSLAFRNGVEIVVTGHRWTQDGWFVLAQDDKGEMAVPYTQVQDAQGMPLYEEREFEAPVVIEKEEKAVPVPAGNPDIGFSRSEPARIAASRGMSADLAQQLLLIMGQAPEYSPAARAQAVAKVRKTVDSIRSAWANGPDVVVAFDMNDAAVPADARAEDLKQRSGGAAGAPEGFYWKGKTYLLASQLSTANDAARVLFHESLGHHGLRGAFGKDLDNILNQVATMRRADVDSKIAEYGLRPTSAVDRRNAAEEVLAEMAQATPQLHFVKRAIAAIRNWLRANVPGFRSLAMSDADIIQAFILPARRYVEQGARPQGGAPVLAFSRSAMKSVDANIGRGRAALARAISERSTVHRAMFRNGLGWVDFVWGSEGVVKASGKTKGGMGLVHILEARQRKDGMSERDAIASLARVVSTIAQGEEISRNTVADTIAVKVEHDGYRVALTKNPGNNAWVVTGFELSQVRGRPEIDARPPMQSPPTLAREKLGADSVAPDDSVPSLDRATHRDSTERGSPAGADDVASLSLDRNESNLAAYPDIANDGAAMFSRSKLADIKSKALEQIHQTLSHPGTVSLWDRSVGTMRNLAERVPAFKPVFEAAQQFIDDVSTLANEAADAAPRLLPRVDSWKDLKKQPISAADNKAVAAPVFEGTLMWGRDVDGTAVLADSLVKKYANISADEKGQLLLRAGRLDDGVLKMWRGLPLAMYEANINARFESQMLKPGVVWTDSELKSIFKANDHQISLYREARAGIDKSIDITSRADMLRALGEEYAGLRDVVMAQATLEDAMKVITDVLQQENRTKPDAGDRISGLNNLVVTRYEQSKKLMDEGYAPLSRFGRYTVDVLDAAGDRQFFGMYETKREANQMALRMRDEFKGGAITQGTMSDEAFKMFQGITPESLEQFAKMLSLSGEPDSAQDKVFQEYLKLAKNNHSALKRLIHRKGIAGYSEDVGRVLASFVYSNARLAAGGLNAGTLENAVQAIPKEQGELRDVAMGLRSYIQDPQEEGQAVRGMLFAQYLGGSL
ncbi:MAG: PLxRFG domain-containing protein, partial [Comamonas sp.]